MPDSNSTWETVSIEAYDGYDQATISAPPSVLMKAVDQLRYAGRPWVLIKIRDCDSTAMVHTKTAQAALEQWQAGYLKRDISDG